MESVNKNLFNEKSKFSVFIHKYTMIFKDPALEKEFYAAKYSRKNLLVAIGIVLTFNMILIGLRFFQIYFKSTFDLFPSQISPTQSLIQILLWNCALILEIPIFFISKLKILRGFFLISLPMIGICNFCYYLGDQIYKTNGPYITISLIFHLLESIIVSLLYSANWIYGSIQILISNIILNIFISIMSGDPLIDKPFNIAINLSISVSLILTIYCIEYFLRKSAFTRVQAEKERNTLRHILDNLPEPIFIIK